MQLNVIANADAKYQERSCVTLMTFSLNVKRVHHLLTALGDATRGVTVDLLNMFTTVGKEHVLRVQIRHSFVSDASNFN